MIPSVVAAWRKATLEAVSIFAPDQISPNIFGSNFKISNPRLGLRTGTVSRKIRFGGAAAIREKLLRSL
jgi:hypothetical protein